MIGQYTVYKGKVDDTFHAQWQEVMPRVADISERRLMNSRVVDWEATVHTLVFSLLL